jgi:hypothetical protein
MRLVDMSLEDERTEEAFEKEQKTVKTTWK